MPQTAFRPAEQRVKDLYPADLSFESLKGFARKQADDYLSGHPKTGYALDIVSGKKAIPDALAEGREYATKRARKAAKKAMKNSYRFLAGKLPGGVAIYARSMIDYSVGKYLAQGPDEDEYSMVKTTKQDLTNKKALAYNVGNRIHLPDERDIRSLVGEPAYKETARRTGLIGKALDKAILDAIAAHEISDVITRDVYGLDHMDDGSKIHAWSNTISQQALYRHDRNAYIAAKTLQEYRDSILDRNTREIEKNPAHVLSEAA
jgi:hypothetical protein